MFRLCVAKDVRMRQTCRHGYYRYVSQTIKEETQQCSTRHPGPFTHAQRERKSDAPKRRIVNAFKLTPTNFKTKKYWTKVLKKFTRDENEMLNVDNKIRKG